MFRKIVLALLLSLQFAAMTSVASAIMPIPRCGPCPTQSGR